MAKVEVKMRTLPDSKMIELGQSVVVEKNYSQADFDQFARLSGDDNPIHVNPDFASQTHFGRTVAHGMLLYSTICAILGKDLPGPGTLQLYQDLMFTSPTFAGERVSFVVSVLEISDQDVLLSTEVVHPDGRHACKGTARVTAQGTRIPRTPVEMDPLDAQVGINLRGLKVGQQANIRRVFHQEELLQFSELTGDTNPLNFDADYARKQGLKDRLVPAGLLGGMISTLLGTKLPGRGTMWLKQHLDFWSPAYPGEQLKASVEIIRMRPEKDLVNLWTEIRNPEMMLVCSGEALVLVRNLMAVV